MLNTRAITSKRPSAALVIAIIALISSLTGTAFAVGALPAGSVTSKQIRTWAVTSTKLKSGAVTGQKIGPNAINSSKIVNRSVQAIDIADGVLPVMPVPAYAQVTGGLTPAFVASTTKSFTAVTHMGLGSYCLTPVAGIKPTERPAVVSVQSAADPLTTPPGQYAVWQADSAGCAAGDYKVRTYRIYVEAMGGPALADDVSFSIIVA